jgi:acyl carrier protein
VLSGGEALPRELARQLAARAESVWNMYGPTETTIWSSVERLGEGGEGREAYQSIGRPIDNTQFYILDARLRPVPAGVSGELYIGGEGVARGYLNRPGLTAERFVPDGWSGAAGARCYATGDVARYLEDGRVEYLGRADQQVKVRGHRIELGEVEAALAGHPRVRAAVAAARPDAAGRGNLLAYVVADGELDGGELRAYLKERLPEYMVPGVFVRLSELPLTPNGKVDRKALPEPRQEPEREAGAARSATEELLAGIWCEALGLERVGIHEDFFELGGNSLLAMRVISKVREVFKVEIALHTLFESPTVAEIAAALERGKAGRGDDVPAIVPLPRDASHYQLSFAQQGLWSIDQIMAGNSAYNIPNAFGLRGRLNVEALGQAIGEVYRRHDVLRAVFPVVEGRPAQVIREPRQLALSVIDLSGLPGEARAARIERLTLAECRRPFDLTRGPLVRAALLKLSAEEHVVLLTMHHIVADGWSMNVLMEEVTRLYGDFSRGAQSRLAELPLQYVDYAAWQRRWLQGEALRAELAYWKEQLADLPEALGVPADGPRPSVQSFRGAQESRLLSRELLDSLASFSRREGSTMYITLLTAYSVLLSWLTSRQDIVVGSPIANRGRAGLEKLIGLFVNMMVLRADVSGNPTFPELLRRVRDVLLGAYAHHELPFEQLVRELQPARNLSRTPLFQVVFVLEGKPETSTPLPGLSVEQLEIDNGSAQIDLTLRMRETPEGLLSLIRYNSDVYGVARITRLLRLMEAVLQKVVAEPESRVEEIKETLDRLNREQQSKAAREFSKNRLAKIRG